MAPRSRVKPRCQNCRRKKIKCDYQQPTCGPCARIGVKCLAYKHETIFIMHGGDTSKAPVVARSWSGPEASQLTMPAVPDGAIQNNTDLYDRFLSIYLPAEEQYTSRWLPSVPRRSGQPRVLEIASQALSTMMMGQRTQDAAILVNARNLYSHALIRLRDGIEQPRPRSEWPQLLLATMMLQILEGISLSGVRGFISHASGIALFIQAAGPEAFQDAPMHQTLLSARASMVAKCIFEGKPTFLASAEWKTVPWAKIPKDDYHTLLDVFVQIPTLLYIMKHKSKGQDVSHVLAKNSAAFLATCRHMNAALDAWYAGVIQRRGPLQRIAANAKVHEPYCVPDFDVRSFSDGQKLLGFWAGKMIVFGIAIDALRHFTPSPRDESPWLDDDYKQQALEIADSICILALYFMRTFDRVVGMQFPMLPLKSAAVCYGFLGMPERQAWCVEQIRSAFESNYGILPK